MGRTLYHVTPATNLAAIEREGLRPSIGARSGLIKELDRAIYCFPTLDAVDSGLGSWLGEEFDEDGALALLRIDLPANREPYTIEVAFEVQVHISIPPEAITVLSRDYGMDRAADAATRSLAEKLGRAEPA